MSLFASDAEYVKQVESDASAKIVLTLLCQEILETDHPVTVQRLLELTEEKRKTAKKMVMRSNTEEMLTDFLHNYSFLFKVTSKTYGRRKVRKVQPHTDVEVCKTWLEKRDSCNGKCGDLHVSSSCLLGTDRQHSWTRNTHNQRVLKANLLDHLSKNHLQVFLRKALNLTSNIEKCTPGLPNLTLSTKTMFKGKRTPRLCFRYNGRSGCDRKDCRFLHLCKHFVLGDCKFGATCRRNHDMTQSQPRSILCQFRMDPHKREPADILEVLKKKLKEIGNESAKQEQEISWNMLETAPSAETGLKSSGFGSLDAQQVQHLDHTEGRPPGQSDGGKRQRKNKSSELSPFHIPTSKSSQNATGNQIISRHSGTRPKYS